MKKLLIALCATAAFGGLASSAFADNPGGTDTSNLTVQATYKQGCTINWAGQATGGIVDFGTFSDIAALHPITASFSVGCNDGSDTALVALDAGSKNTDVMKRAMWTGSDTTHPLYFNVFIGPHPSGDIWGDKDTGSEKIYKAQISTIGGKTIDNDFTVQVDPNQTFTGDFGEYKTVMVATITYSKATPANNG